MPTSFPLSPSDNMSHSVDKPLFTTLRFVPSNGNPKDGTRRIAAQACEACRKKKKRCSHLLGSPSGLAAGSDEQSSTPSALPDGSTPTSHTSKDSKSDRPRKRPKTSGTPLSTAETHSRFIGDLNPNVELLSASNPVEPLRNNVGVWHDENSADLCKSSDGRDCFTPSSLFHSSSQHSQGLLNPLLKELCSNLTPPVPQFQAMEDFYFTQIDPILPAIDTDLYRAARAGSPSRTLQEQIICILASVNPAMARHLHLPNWGDLLPAEFASKVIGGMRLTIELSLVSEKTVVIRALIAMSLVTHSPESIDLASEYFVRAVHLAYTMGLHLPQDKVRDERVAGLFCYIWSIDRLHAAIQGRPIFMHTIDMGKHPRDCMIEQSPGFQVLTYIATLLDKTIALYRPAAPEAGSIDDVEFPTFEEILTECDALNIPGNLLSTLELFYHSVGILSCRHRRGGSNLQGHLTRNARQMSSALQINSIMEEGDRIILLPFVPYAVSLALSAAYRDFKHCKAVNHRNRAKKRIAESRLHLRRYGRAFWSACFVEKLATKIILDWGDTNQEVDASEESQMPQNGVQPNVSQPMDVALGQNWNAEDMDGILEGNLDPSMPWSFQDIEGFLAMPDFGSVGY